VLAELKACHWILKAPTTTPEKGGPYPNIESANVPCGANWTCRQRGGLCRCRRRASIGSFSARNTEGAYILGSKGIQVTEDLAIDFTAVTKQGCERIIEMAFQLCAHQQNPQSHGGHQGQMSSRPQTGCFLETAERIGKRYPDINGTPGTSTS
jgi:isocitrate dehydrogenase (NAD+)